MSEGIVNHLAFSEELGLLKHIDRKGWVIIGVPCPERIAGHMYRMAVLAMTLDPIPGCDMVKVMKMCLVHDLPESRVGDITPHDKVPDEEKHKMEREAMINIAGLLPKIPRESMIQLYSEYEKHESIEAKVTKDLDRFDMVHQAWEYEKSLRQSCRRMSQNGLNPFSDLKNGINSTTNEHNSSIGQDFPVSKIGVSSKIPDLSEFFDDENILSRIENPQIKGWIKEITDQRSLFFTNSTTDANEEDDSKCSSNHHTL